LLVKKPPARRLIASTDAPGRLVEAFLFWGECDLPALLDERLARLAERVLALARLVQAENE